MWKVTNLSCFGGLVEIWVLELLTKIAGIEVLLVSLSSIGELIGYVRISSTVGCVLNC